MPLSEHEQRLLEQMERALLAEDPKLATTLRGTDLRKHYRRRVLFGVLGLVAGIALLVVGVASKLVPVSVVGFVVMLGAALWAAGSWRRIPVAGDPGTGSGAPTVQGGAPRPAARRRGGAPAGKRPPRASFMDRLEERWRRRREGDGR
ncbi:MAG: DUF3040 domain-containing protein [Actinomycetia bacterium]|nr:DUF3040 domain-containing protein [Actinomycetes bacterium]